MWQDIKIDCAVDIGWALDTTGWVCAQSFPTLAMPLVM